MKRLSAVLIISLISVYCFAQTQTGDASYNPSKRGLTLAHSSMSFGTRVRITNERNNREVIAVVDGRIPTTDPRVADISGEAGDAIGMPRTGYTRVRLEQLPPEHQSTAPVTAQTTTPPVTPAATPAVVPATTPTVAAPAVTPTVAPAALPPVTPAITSTVATPAVVPTTVPAALPPASTITAPANIPAPAPPVTPAVTPAAASAPVPVTAPAPALAVTPSATPTATPSAASATDPAAPSVFSAGGEETRINETIQFDSSPQAFPTVQYVPALSPEGQNSFNSPLCVAIFVLLIVVILLLVAILILLLYIRRFPWRPWYYPAWFRRHLRYLKKRVYKGY